MLGELEDDFTVGLKRISAEAHLSVAQSGKQRLVRGGRGSWPLLKGRTALARGRVERERGAVRANAAGFGTG